MPSDTPKIVRRVQVSHAFSPAAPIDDLELFADRPDQSMACISAFFQRGRHIALYGERGVGKTSLANMIPSILQAANLPNVDAIRVDCNTNDTYNGIWRKVFRRLEMPIPEQMEITAPGSEVDPEEIVYLLEKRERRNLIVIDEFDRMENDDALSLLADTVKSFADASLPTTLMFVGVASSLTNLLGEHESIVRNVEQVRMPRMSATELGVTLDQGFDRIDDLTLEPAARTQIIQTAEGLPHYAHTLGSAAALAAIEDDRDVATVGDVNRAEGAVIRTHSMVSDYRAATQSPQPGHLFEEVLLACAYAPRDSVGYFRPADIRAPLSLITGRPMDFANFQRHLTEMAEEHRHALYKEGPKRHYVYRFRDPLLQPYVKMLARATRKISSELSRQLAEDQQRLSVGSLLDPETTEPQLPFEL
jgi:energy-coupling factor transporter ATP-binding protein EcfA2